MDINRAARASALGKALLNELGENSVRECSDADECAGRARRRFKKKITLYIPFYRRERESKKSC